MYIDSNWVCWTLLSEGIRMAVFALAHHAQTPDPHLPLNPSQRSHPQQTASRRQESWVPQAQVMSTESIFDREGLTKTNS